MIPDDVRAEIHHTRAGKAQRFGLLLSEADDLLDALTTTLAAHFERQGAEKAAVVVESFARHYPGDIFDPEGTSVDAASARVIRILCPAIVVGIRTTLHPTTSTEEVRVLVTHSHDGHPTNETCLVCTEEATDVQ